MPVTILDGPAEVPRECFFCKDLNTFEKLHIAIYKKNQGKQAIRQKHYGDIAQDVEKR